MKRIQRLSARTRGLEDYLAVETRGASWDRFCSHDAGRAKRELVEELVRVQHGLCGYCEISLTERDRQIEHVVPQSDPQRGELLALDSGNLIACCKGGTARSGDGDRFLKPVKRNRSCGESKGNRANGSLLDPRKAPSLPSVMRVLDDGLVVADDAACTSAGVSANDVAYTIEVLNLNGNRLRVAREKRWRHLNEEWVAVFGDPDAMTAAARDELLPVGGRLPGFFTTARSYFRPIAERVLDQQPRAWI